MCVPTLIHHPFPEEAPFLKQQTATYRMHKFSGGIKERERERERERETDDQNFCRMGLDPPSL